MANTNTNVTPQLLAQGVLALREMAITSRHINRSYESMAASRGSQIEVPIPSAIAARSVTAAVTFNSNIDSSPTRAIVTLDRWMEASFHMSDQDRLTVMDGVIPMQASEAVKSLGNDIDQYILGKHTGFFGAVGTAGTAPFNGSLNVAGSARELLNRQLAPLDNRVAIVDPFAETNLLLNTQVLQFDQRGDTGGIVAGSIGTKLGFAWYMNQNISTYTPGTGWVTGFSASTVAGAVGDTTLNVLNATASGSIKVGDIFKLTATGLGYVVTVTTTVSATVAVAITFQPPLRAAVATGSALIVQGSTAYTVNLALHRDAMAFASRPLADANDGLGNIMASPVDPVTGVALRLELSRQFRQNTWAYDVLYGANVIRRELGVKILG